MQQIKKSYQTDFEKIDKNSQNSQIFGPFGERETKKVKIIYATLNSDL